MSQDLYSNSFIADAPFMSAQRQLITRLQDKYMGNVLAEGRKLAFDSQGEPVLWVKDGKDLMMLIASFKIDPDMMIDFLSDITAYDNKDKKDGPKRFIMVYQLFSTTKHVRVRLKLAVDDGEAVPTLVHEWKGANWLEREVYDMYGIKFAGHPNLRRIMMDERFTGFPLRKEYPIKKRESFSDNIPLHLGEHALPPNAGK